MTSQLSSEDILEQALNDIGGPSRYQALLAFVKEWGGVATVLIAILYTFPFDVAAKAWNWHESNLATARVGLSEAATLQAERISSVSRMTDSDSANMLAASYTVRIINILEKNYTLFLDVANRMKFSEVYEIGGLYGDVGDAEESIKFLEIARNMTAGNEPELLGVLNEMGKEHFLISNRNEPSSTGSLTAGREAFLTALNLIDAHSALPWSESYLRILSELGVNELRMGDWKCGTDILAVSLRAYGFLVNIDKDRPAYDDYNHYGQLTVSTLPLPGRLTQGCPYTAPLVKIPNLILQASVAAGFSRPASPRVSADVTAASTSGPVSPPVVLNTAQ